MALAHAIAICANLHIPLPEWAARGFVTGYRNLINYNTDSWQSVLGRPIPKGLHLKAQRKRRTKAFAVWLRVNELHEAGRTIDDELFREVGKMPGIGIGATLVKQYYSEEKQTMLKLREQLEAREA